MNRSMFADNLQQAIMQSWSIFRQTDPLERPYAFALIGALSADYYLGYAIATEETLIQTTIDYESRGYRYQALEWEEFDNREKLAVWLRWANPDDGWYYGEFPPHFQILTKLEKLVSSGQLGTNGEEFEEFCVDILTSLQTTASWRKQIEKSKIIVGFTYGEDPRDFLRTATRINPNPWVCELWKDYWYAEELGSRIKLGENRGD